VAPYSGQFQVSKLGPQKWLVIDASGVFDICTVRSRGNVADAPGLPVSGWFRRSGCFFLGVRVNKSRFLGGGGT